MYMALSVGNWRESLCTLLQRTKVLSPQFSGCPVTLCSHEFLCFLGYLASFRALRLPLVPGFPCFIWFPSCHQQAGIVLVVVSPEMSGGLLPHYLLERMPWRGVPPSVLLSLI